MREQQKDSIVPLNVFISYAYKDKTLCDQPRTQLSPLQHEGIITE